MMGCSNPHPHGQAWSLSHIPSEAGKVLSSLKQYTTQKPGSNLLLDYAQMEVKTDSPRVIIKSEHFVALTPFWALWPFEVIICPHKRRIPHLLDLSAEEKADMASVLRRMTCRYDNRELWGLVCLSNSNIPCPALSCSLHLLYPLHSLPMLLPVLDGYLPMSHIE